MSEEKEEHISLLDDLVPENLRITDGIVGVNMAEDVTFFETDEYLLVEIFPRGHPVSAYKVARAIRDIIGNSNKLVVIRGYGFKGTGVSATIAHELKQRRKDINYKIAFDTFTAINTETDEKYVSVQLVIIPESLIH